MTYRSETGRIQIKIAILVLPNVKAIKYHWIVLDISESFEVVVFRSEQGKNSLVQISKIRAEPECSKADVL